jgi:hypothetical protein
MFGRNQLRDRRAAAVFNVTLPDLPLRQLSLASEQEARGTGAPGAPPLQGRILLGGPLCVPVTAASVAHDDELSAFVQGEAGIAAFYLMHLSITCAGQPDSPDLHTVGVNLTLVADPGAAFQPVAWSMTPKKLTETVQNTTSAQLGPQLAFVGHSQTTSQSSTCLEALRELRSDPGWEIRRTANVRIGGGYRLAMVVRAPHGTQSRAEVSVRATVRRGPVLWRYREDVRDPLSLTVAL